MEFGYDYSRLHQTHEIVVSADFRVSDGVPDAFRAIARESLAFRKRTQPLESASAGCIFQNPDPARDGVPDGIPWSAGALVDRAGLKDARDGRARVSTTHANFIVNEGGATAEGIYGIWSHAARRRWSAVRRHIAGRDRVFGIWFVVRSFSVQGSGFRVQGSVRDSRPLVLGGPRSLGSHSLNPEPRTPNPEPRTPNPEPRTPNPEPRTPNQRTRRGSKMATLRIEGGRRLEGRVAVEGNKNSALPLVAACLLTDQPCEITNVPRIRDVGVLVDLLVGLGATVDGRVHRLSVSRVRR